MTASGLAGDTHPSRPALLSVRGVSKRFPGVQALSGIDLDLGTGEVLALLGENGAGKSTLLKILSGAQAADVGTILLNGVPYVPAQPHEAQANGVVTIYQEFTLIPTLSVAENIMIGREPGRAGFVHWGATFGVAREALSRLGLSINPRRLVRDLSVADQQMVEIARALSMEARLIIMDEPTAALSVAEVERLLALVRILKGRGIGIIYVTHRLDEVMTVCDRATVLRDGRLVGSADIATTSIDHLIRMMVGRDLGAMAPVEGGSARPGVPALRVSRLCTRNTADPHATTVTDITLSVQPGEILGIAGLVGAGRTELARAIFGADSITGGQIFVEGREVAIRSPADAIALGIGLVPEDRKQQALFLSLAIRNNMAVTAMGRRRAPFDYVSDAWERGLVREFQKALGIRMASPDQAIGNLSGGNQQKVVLARWLALKPKILIVDEPTRGIDVAAKAEVHGLLGRLAQDGIAVIVISSELPEVIALADRIVTLREGRLTGEVARRKATEESLMRLMTLRTALEPA
ncbi:sugar ABC transporter ATP-binding protein [Lichenifustis flavocetrariae]|uniref:Sugar ABC transporter ATP-binding protein n=1 Tax=Lichenifustis flavocetrariae TaxID=2949735 RepID=A0AA41YVQ6_9HYPH|nr:sugar ABC transporter ATP-binding protein [Lichenifustis flavocetrariae]MCW6508190.1 sugar ABC transporter ATP-binding protein [Lichenifustis flavocetrariae]